MITIYFNSVMQNWTQWFQGYCFHGFISAKPAVVKCEPTNANQPKKNCPLCPGSGDNASVCLIVPY